MFASRRLKLSLAPWTWWQKTLQEGSENLEKNGFLVLEECCDPAQSVLTSWCISGRIFLFIPYHTQQQPRLPTKGCLYRERHLASCPLVMWKACFAFLYVPRSYRHSFYLFIIDIHVTKLWQGMCTGFTKQEQGWWTEVTVFQLSLTTVYVYSHTVCHSLQGIPVHKVRPCASTWFVFSPHYPYKTNKGEWVQISLLLTREAMGRKSIYFPLILWTLSVYQLIKEILINRRALFLSEA